MANAIEKNTPVSFVDIDGQQTGVVLGVLKDISNGQSCAVIELDHYLRGCIRSVPLVELQACSASQRIRTNHSSLSPNRNASHGR